jgi:hypothetical protein
LKAKKEIENRSNSVRPASGTVVKNGKTGSPNGDQHDSSRSTTPRNSFIEPPENKAKSKKGKPSALKIDNNSRHIDPNAANITPQNSGGKNKEQRAKRHEEDLNKMAMFIPWEKPALGADGKSKKSKPPKLGQRRSSKSGKKRKSGGGPGSRLSASTKFKKDDEPQEFIPGSGNEKILMASAPSINPKFLAPISFEKVKADKNTMSQIEKDRARVKAEKAKVKEITNFIKSECGFDSKTAKLIRQYAELGPSTQKGKFVLAVKDNKSDDAVVTVPIQS